MTGTPVTLTYNPQSGSLRAQVRDVLLRPDVAGRTVNLKWLVRQVNTKGLADPERTIRQVMSWIVRIDLVPGLAVITRGKQWRCPTVEQTAVEPVTDQVVADLTAPTTTVEQTASPALVATLTPTWTPLRTTKQGAVILSSPDGRWWEAREI